MGMFDFYNDIDNYEERKVANFEGEGFVIDTAAASDGRQPYETGIEHPEYRNGRWVIVEAYNTKEEAKVGHDKWVKTMTAKELPKELIDCANAEICGMIGYEKEVFPRVKLNK